MARTILGMVYGYTELLLWSCRKKSSLMQKAVGGKSANLVWSEKSRNNQSKDIKSPKLQAQKCPVKVADTRAKIIPNELGWNSIKKNCRLRVE